MDKNRFDGFTRQLAKRENRRQAIKTLFAGGAATAVTVLAGGETGAAKTDCCPADHPTLCGLTCTDTIDDSSNCGGCGVTCPAGQHCYKSACENDDVVHCATAANCPSAPNECSTPTCKKGMCGTAYVANGKKAANQTPGDCQRNVCDGSGHIIVITDNTDKPAAQGECWTGVCVDGTPHQNALPSGRKCSTGKCDGAGHCSGSTPACSSASDCPGADTECQVRTCTNGACGVQNTPNGTLTNQQTPGDCKKNVCDGAGNVITVNDDSDFTPPYYGTPCLDSICTNGVPSNPQLPAGTPCIGGGGVCDAAGNCVGCITDADCPDLGVGHATPFCSNGFCSYQCQHGWGDCIPDGIGGCETNLDTDPANCGACNAPCTLPHATAGCNNGACTIVACDQGWNDCNDIASDGCEVNTSSDTNNCGSCGNACGSGQSCINSMCQ